MQRPEPLAERLMAIVTRTFHGLLWQARESLELLGLIEFFIATAVVIVAISVVIITTVIAIATAATLVAVVAATAAEVAGATLVVFLVHGAPATHVI